MEDSDDAPGDDATRDAVLPMRRIAALWDWLPAFRAVAETENLRRAATFLALSPPALSRTLKLLEEEVGRALFVREGRRLRLTSEGSALLRAVRRAMRSIDDALEAPSSTLKLWVCPLLAPLVLAAELPLPFAATSGELAPEVLVQELQRGAFDLAIVPRAAAPSAPPGDVVLAPVGDIEMVLLGVTHQGPDVAVPAITLGTHDGWPTERAREVVVKVPDVASALLAHARGLALALPRALASQQDVVPGGRLAIVALRRPPRGGAGERETAAIEAVRKALSRGADTGSPVEAQARRPMSSLAARAGRAAAGMAPGRRTS